MSSLLTALSSRPSCASRASTTSGLRYPAAVAKEYDGVIYLVVVRAGDLMASTAPARVLRAPPRARGRHDRPLLSAPIGLEFFSPCIRSVSRCICRRRKWAGRPFHRSPALRERQARTAPSDPPTLILLAPPASMRRQRCAERGAASPRRGRRCFVGVTLVGEKLGADWRLVVRRDVGYASACSAVVDLDDLVDFWELAVAAPQLRGARLSIGIDELDVVCVPAHTTERIS